MTSRITESEFEEFSIELLESLSYQYIYGPDIAPDLPAPCVARQAGNGNVYEELSDRRNIVVIADEAHCTQ